MDKLPPHKVIPGTTFTVDGFRSVSPAVTAYFLSHAHSGGFAAILLLWMYSQACHRHLFVEQRRKITNALFGESQLFR
jgi:hypothetical protein